MIEDDEKQGSMDENEGSMEENEGSMEENQGSMEENQGSMDESEMDDPTGCRYPNNDKLKYGICPLDLRWGVDSTGLTFNGVNQSLNFQGTGQCVITTPKKDVTKRMCSLHVCLRLRGEQVVPPVIIFQNAKPNKKSPFKMPRGLDKKVNFNGKRAKEKSFYHPDAKVLFQKKAWLDEETAINYFEWALPIMDDCRSEWIRENPDWTGDRDSPDYLAPLTGIQQDNHSAQNTKDIKLQTFAFDTFVWNTIEGCTDCTAWLDQWFLREMKLRIDEKFWADFSSSDERMKWYMGDDPKNKISESSWRILITHWVMETWAEMTDGHLAKQIFKTAQHVGWANCSCGCENDLIKLGSIKSYTVGKPNDPELGPVTVQRAAEMERLDKLQRAVERRNARQKRRDKAKQKRIKKFQ